MGKNKKLIFVGIIITVIIVALLVIWRCSTSLIKKNETSESQLPQATEEVTTQGDDSKGTETTTNTVDTSNWDLTKVDIVYDTANVAVPVPKGYVASKVDGENTVNTGFVIYEGTTEVTNDNKWNESCTRNQWVWIPVPEVNNIYETDSRGKKISKLYKYNYSNRELYTNKNYEPGILTSSDTESNFSRNGLQGMTKKKLLNELQKEFENTIESIQTYGGFWIGRYETGNLSEDKPVVQRMNTNICNLNWYRAYTKLQRINTNENVRTSMIFGCLYDETLQWLINTGRKYESDMLYSARWGNYGGTVFEYKTDINGNTVTKTSNLMIPTGSTEYSNVNNIYDLVGNVRDGTLEAYGPYKEAYGRICRGGNFVDYGGKNPASNRNDYNNPDSSNGVTGYRAFLYIKK